MKLLVIGLGGCGGRLADEFARLNQRARWQRKTTVVIDVFAIHTDPADLSTLRKVKSDYQHRILIGGRKVGSHGVGSISELAAEIAREDGDKVIDAIRQTSRLFESDAFLLIAGAAGGTGSGSIPIVSELIKERYGGKPLYNLIVLPLEYEEHTEERAIYNSGTCLRLASKVTDAIFLVDNQRYARKDASLRNNLGRINTRITEPFYNILCTGEERGSKYKGTRSLNTGDIIPTLSGWAAIGYGRSLLQTVRFPFKLLPFLSRKGSEADRGVEAMKEAVDELSFSCDPKDAARALYLLTAPSEEINLTMMEKLGEHLRALAPNALIGSGDYPRGKGSLDISIILSDLVNVKRIEKYYDQPAG